MNEIRFDDVARTCALASSRRRLLGGIAVGALGTVALGLGSATATPKGKKGRGPKNRGFRFHGEGNVTSAGAEGCQSTPEGCDVTMDGDGNAAHLGRLSFSGTLTVLWAEATPNPDGGGGFCAAATGETVLVAGGKKKKQGTLTLSLDGTDCEMGGTGQVPHRFTGAYEITGGTGRFEGATGQGALEALNDGGPLTVDAKGKIRF